MPQQDRSWSIQRHFRACSQGWRRWDQAYQLLLASRSPRPPPGDREEGVNENSYLCPRFDFAASAEPDHRTTTGAATDALPGPAVVLAGRADLSRVICYSGATLRRPGLERLRDQAANGGFEQVIITAPDRLARKYVHQMLLIEELEGHGGPGPFPGATHERGSQ